MTINVQNLQQVASGLSQEVQTALGGALRAQDSLNASMAQQLNALPPGPWLRPQFLNGWVDFDLTSAPPRIIQFRMEQGGYIARMQGAMASGTVGVNAFTLPQALWPAQRLNFAVPSNNAFGQARVDSDGSVLLVTGSNVSANLNFSWAVRT